MSTTTDALSGGRRCLLALGGGAWPLLISLPYWHDGEAAWAILPADLLAPGAGRDDGEERPCALLLPGDGVDVAARARMRVLSLDDPVALVLYAPAIAGAVAGLALADPATLVGYALDALRAPAGWAPGSRVVLRIALTDAEEIVAGEPPPGVAPALPPVVPADVRRAVAGRRRVALACAAGRGVELRTGWWGDGFALSQPGPSGGAASAAAGAAGRAAPVPDGPVAVAVDVAGAQPLAARGLALLGRVEDGRLLPSRATWWRGVEVASADVPVSSPGVVLPD